VRDAPLETASNSRQKHAIERAQHDSTGAEDKIETTRLRLRVRVLDLHERDRSRLETAPTRASETRTCQTLTGRSGGGSGPFITGPPEPSYPP